MNFTTCSGGTFAEKAKKPPEAAHALPRHSLGNPLPASLQNQAQAFFPSSGFDFGSLRVHDDLASRQSMRQLGVAALQQGRDLHFADGAYAPHTLVGRALLGHEIAHAVQTRGLNSGSLPFSLPSAGDNASAETLADRAGAAFALNRGPVAVGQVTTTLPMGAPKAPTIEEVQGSASSALGGTPMTTDIDYSSMQAIYPALPDDQVLVMQTRLNRAFDLFQIDTIESRAFFLAQAFVESSQFGAFAEADLAADRLYQERDEISEDKTLLPGHVTQAQNSDFSSAGRGYQGRTDINPPNAPKDYTGPKGPNTWAYIGRGPLQLTTSRGYRNVISPLRQWAKIVQAQESAQERWENTEVSRIQIDTELSLTDGEKIDLIADRIEQNPALVADPDYGFIVAMAQMKMGLSVNGGNAFSMDKNAGSLSSGDVSATRMLSKSGPMAGVASVASMKEQKFSFASCKAVCENMNIKAKEYVRIRKILCGIEGLSADACPEMTGGGENCETMCAPILTPAKSK